MQLTAQGSDGSMKCYEPMKYKGSLLIFSIFLTFIFYLGLGRFRLIDGDEGFYLYATKLFIMGKQPYFDFFYPQMPAFLYVYSIFGELFDSGWYVYRGVGAFLATLCAGVIVWYSFSRLRNFKVSLLLLCLYVCSGMCVGWFVVAKTYALSAVLLSVSAVFFLCYLENKNRYLLFGCAIALGLLGATRLMLFGVAPVFVYFLWCSRSSLRDGLLALSVFMGGLCLGVSPLLLYVFDGWSAFWFNNLGYHGIRSGNGFIGDFDQKKDVLKELIGIRANKGDYFGIQNLVLVLALWHLRRGLVSPQSKFLALLFLALICISFMPTPTFSQYFVVLIPVALLFTFELLRYGLVSGKPFYSKKYMLSLVVLYALAFPLEVYRYTVSGNRVPGITDANEWKIEAVSKVSVWINRNAHEGAKVVSFWPGFLVESEIVAVPGSDNHFAWQIVDKLTASDAENFRIMTFDQLLTLIQAKQLDFLVLNHWTERRDFVESQLLKNAYSKVYKLNDAVVWASMDGSK